MTKNWYIDLYSADKAVKKKAVVFSREIEDNRCAMQHHACLHMRAVGLVVYQAMISVHCPRHILCMKAVACIHHTPPSSLFIIVIMKTSWNKAASCLTSMRL